MDSSTLFVTSSSSGHWVLNSYCFVSKYKARIDRLIVIDKNDISTREKRKSCFEMNKRIKTELTDAGKDIVNAFVKKWKKKV